jgi:two-component system sensor histidine kinase/response regulator
MTHHRDPNPQVALNLPELLVRVDNDRDLLRELIDIFKEEFPRLLRQLQANILDGDRKSVENTCHGLKGMLSGLSAMRAAAVAERLEQLGRDGDFSALKDLVAVLEQEVETLVPQLDASIHKAEP